MLERKVSKPVIICMVSVFFTFCLWLFPGYASQQSQVISVETQQGVPLLILNPEINLTDPQLPQIKFELKNRSGKAVSAYAIHLKSNKPNGSSEKVTLEHLLALSSVLQPNMSKAEAITAEDYIHPVPSYTLAIDFVEFVDGSAWGVDKFKSGERLAGRRAGFAVEKNRFLKVLKEKGVSALKKAIDDADVVDDGETPSGRSQEWGQGFNTGRKIIQIRLQRAQKRGGISEVELELQSPNDALEGRRQEQ
ncbi:MAG TPA: hypothetical protein VGW12_09740 [Pyrinomonadaceae bacterium]|nr:hypothetical protein [Pyrinomonadaceae bacterium]